MPTPPATVERDLVDLVAGQRVLQQPVLRVGRELLAEPLELVGGELSVGCHESATLARASITEPTPRWDGNASPTSTCGSPPLTGYALRTG